MPSVEAVTSKSENRKNVMEIYAIELPSCETHITLTSQNMTVNVKEYLSSMIGNIYI